MKKIFTFCVSLLAALSVFAYDFQSGDLFYNITSSSAPYTVEVTYEEYSSDNYSGLTTATIPASVSYNGITYSVTSIGESAFNHSKLTTITISNTVTSIGDEAFYGCSSLTSITIPNSVTSIGIDAFLECESLTSVTVSNSVTTIGKWAFSSCFSLTSITIPNSVTSIGAYAFYDCESLTSITCEATTPPTLGSYAFPSELTTAYIPCGTKEAYEASAWASQVSEFIEEDCPEPIDPTWQITYTSTDGNIVTPYATDVFGANIVSNTYENGVGTITFDGPMTSIGNKAFYRCSTLTSISIPNSVTSIGSAAFCDCPSLTSITIPNSVTSIGSDAFLDCSSLLSITIPDGVTKLEDHTFACCYKLQNVILSNSLTFIDDNVFSECYSLVSITIPNSVTNIGHCAFSDCWSLTEITIPNSVMSIEDEAFYCCNSLTSVTLNSNTFVSKTSRMGGKFGSQVTEYVIGEGVTSIGSAAFCDCPSLTSITIPNSVTSIGSDAFLDCSSLLSITIPDGVTKLEAHTFACCYKLQNVILPNSLTFIDDNVFSECYSLVSITIPSSVTNIGLHAFSDCPLDTIHVEVTPPLALGARNPFTSSPVCVIPCGTLSAYEASDWAQYVSEFVEEGCIDSTWQIKYTSTDGNIVTPYATDVFGANIVSNTYENGVGTITFDAPITSVGEEAFQYCSSLTSITIPNSVTSIGYYAFQDCSSLTSITIPNSVTSIGDYAFEDCTSLTSITIPNSVTSIGDYAFRNCTSLTSITIPNSVTSIGRLAFGICSSLTSMTVENGNTVYDSRENCNAIIETATNTLIAGCQNTIIPNSVTIIGGHAFSGCFSLTSITIPNSVTSIGGWAFRDCTSLASVVIPESVTSIGDGAFSSCDNLSSVIIPNSVTSIGDYAFNSCSSLTSITIPNSVMSIGTSAFNRCSSLTSITIPNSVTSIGDGAFAYCSSLDTIYVEATTPPALEDSTVFRNTPSPVCVIPCGTLAAYEVSDWAQYVSEFVEEGCAPIQMCGDNLYWEYADGVLTITGTGDMYDYAADTDVPWYDVRGNIKTVSLPDAMTKIGQNAFYKCTAMTTINMPTSLTAIGEKAFAQDTKLTGELTLPASLTTIDERAFFNCKAVTAFHIEATTPPTLQDKAFDYVVSPIHVPCGYGHVYGKHAQWGMLNLEMCELLQDNVYYYPIDGHTARAVTYHSNPTDTIVIPSAVVIDGVLRTVTEVADYAFTDCDNLPAIYFNEGLEYIGERAFVRCYGLKGTITLPTTLTTIGERAFSYCDNVEKYLLQAMTPPVLGEDVFTGNNKNALFYISCEAMDDYKIATNWSSLKSRLRDACLNIYHYNTPFPLGTNGVYTTEDTLVASIHYRRQFTPYRWETLYLPFEVDRVTVLEDGVEYDLTAWDIVNGGHYFLAKPDGTINKEILFGFTDELESHTPYIIQFSDTYYADKLITFYGKESWNKLSTSFEVLSSSAWMQIAGNTTLQDQLLEKPVYMLRSGLDFILQKTTTTLHPFECYVMPYTVQSGAPARMSVRLRDDVATAVESMKGNESRLAYTINGNTLTVYPQGQAFSIYSLNGALIYSCEAGKETVDCELNSGCYLLHAGTEAHKIML